MLHNFFMIEYFSYSQISEIKQYGLKGKRDCYKRHFWNLPY